jgi:hypothetical protein
MRMSIGTILMVMAVTSACATATDPASQADGVTATSPERQAVIGRCIGALEAATQACGYYDLPRDEAHRALLCGDQLSLLSSKCLGAAGAWYSCLQETQYTCANSGPVQQDCDQEHADLVACIYAHDQRSEP